MLDTNELNQIALKIINKNINEWGFEDTKGFVVFTDGVLQFLIEILKYKKEIFKNNLKNCTIKGEENKDE